MNWTLDIDEIDDTDRALRGFVLVRKYQDHLKHPHQVSQDFGER